MVGLMAVHRGRGPEGATRTVVAPGEHPPPLVLPRSLSLRQALAEKYSCPAALLATPAVSCIIDKAAASEASELIEASLAEAEAEAPPARGAARKRKSR